MPPAEQQEVLNEAKVMSQVNHPCFIRFYESFIENGVLAIVMEFATRLVYCRQKPNIRDAGCQRG